MEVKSLETWGDIVYHLATLVQPKKELKNSVHVGAKYPKSEINGLWEERRRWKSSTYTLLSSLSMKFFVVKYFFGESTQNRSFLWRYPNLKLHVYTNQSRDSVPNFFFWHQHVINKVRSNFRVNRSILCVFKGLRTL